MILDTDSLSRKRPCLSFYPYHDKRNARLSRERNNADRIRRAPIRREYGLRGATRVIQFAGAGRAVAEGKPSEESPGSTERDAC